MERAELDRALAKIEIETYLDREGISYSVSYGTKGQQLNLHECPACGEGGRKTYINADTGLGNCFHGSCNARFNKFWLIRHVSGLAGADLDRHICGVAEDQGWMPKTQRAQITQGGELKLPSKLHPIPINGENLQYLADRGVSIPSCLAFGLAYCHKGWWKYTLSDGTEKFVSYDARVVIPIADLEGNLVSFQGRDIRGRDAEGNPILPKYLFPVGYAVAGQHLFNGQNFKEGETTHAIVGEGAFDAIGIHQAIEGSSSCAGMLPLATFGMHLSDGPGGQFEKFSLLKARGLKTVTFMWDGEVKATSYAVKMGLKLIGLGLMVRIARLPPGYDPAQGPDGKPTPAAMVRKAIFEAVKLDRLSAVKLLGSMLKAGV